jgi:acid phosphatase
MSKKFYLLVCLFWFSFLLLTACQPPEPTPTAKPQPLTFTVTPDESKASGQPENPANENEADDTQISEDDQGNQCIQIIPESSLALMKLNSILYVQTSAEYEMAATQSYALAAVMLDKALADPNWTAAIEQLDKNYSNLPPAIILDVDETVLDNSPNQVRLVYSGSTWDINLWNEWVNQAKAPAVPGSLEFVKYAHDQGVTVFFMTNRSYELEPATRKNLKALGFPVDTNYDDTLLTNGEQEDWGTDKATRRDYLAEEFRILLLIGDDPNDFVSGTKEGNPITRNELFSSFQDFWGEKWIILPNPMYGGWDAALYDFDYSLPQEEKFNKMYDWLDPME